MAGEVDVGCAKGLQLSTPETGVEGSRPDRLIRLGQDSDEARCFGRRRNPLTPPAGRR
jgi:hypothetical protein